MPTGAQNLIFIGIRGVVLALDRRTGQVVWETPLKGWDFVNLVVDGNDLLATAKGEVSCLDPSTGRIRWTNPLRGYGYGIISIATQNPNSAAAAAENRRREEASSDSSATVAATAAM